MIDEQFEVDFLKENEIREQEISKQILDILNNFVRDKKYILYFNRSKNNHQNIINILFNNRWIIFGSYLMIVCVVYLVIFAKSGLPTLFIKFWGSFTLLLTFGLTGYVCWKICKPIFIELKEVKNQAIFRAANYKLEPYRQVIKDLGESFDEEDLNREELRFELIIEERKKILNKTKQANPLLAVLLIALTLWIFGTPEKNTELNFLYGTVVGIPGVVFITKVLLDLFLYSVSEDIDIYKKCIFILRKAQFIAKKEQEDAIQVYENAINLDDEILPFESAISEIE